MTEKQIIINDLKINYKVFGEGKPMLILHGWGSNLGRWGGVAEKLAEYNLKVIVLDLPGFGESEEPKSAWTIDNYVDFVKNFTDRLPELQNHFYLAGHSFGGAVATKFTLQYAQQVEKLFLMAAACFRKKTTPKKASANVSKIVKIFSFLPGYALFRKAIYKYVIRKSDYAHLSGIMKETYLKVIADDLSQKLLFIKVPTVIIWGDKDDLTPIEDAYFMNQRIDGSKLLVMENIGHDLDRHKHPELLVKNIIENL